MMMMIIESNKEGGERYREGSLSRYWEQVVRPGIERKNWLAMRIGTDFASAEYLADFCLESCLLTWLSVFRRWHRMHTGNAAWRKGGL